MKRNNSSNSSLRSLHNSIQKPGSSTELSSWNLNDPSHFTSKPQRVQFSRLNGLFVFVYIPVYTLKRERQEATRRNVIRLLRNPRTRCGSLRIGLSDEHSAVGSCNSPPIHKNVYNSIFELLFKILHRAVKQKLLSLSLSLFSIIVWSNLRKKEGNREREKRKSNSSCSRMDWKKKKNLKKVIFTVTRFPTVNRKLG